MRWLLDLLNEQRLVLMDLLLTKRRLLLGLLLRSLLLTEHIHLLLSLLTERIHLMWRLLRLERSLSVIHEQRLLLHHLLLLLHLLVKERLSRVTRGTGRRVTRGTGRGISRVRRAVTRGRARSLLSLAVLRIGIVLSGVCIFFWHKIDLFLI